MEKQPTQFIPEFIQRESNQHSLQRLRERHPIRMSLPKSFAHFAYQLEKTKKLKVPSRLVRFQKAWNKIIDDSLSQTSQVHSYRQGELRIKVQSQAHVHELGVFRQKELVKDLNEVLNDKDRVSSLKVFSGSIRNKKRW